MALRIFTYLTLLYQDLVRANVTWLRQVRSQPRMKQLAQVDWAAANNLLAVRSMLAERINQWTEQLLRQGREQVLAAERDLLVRQVHRRFGADCADRLGRLLAGIDDPAVLSRIGELVVERDEAGDFLSGVAALLS